jgi:hypothetical protein
VLVAAGRALVVAVVEVEVVCDDDKKGKKTGADGGDALHDCSNHSKGKSRKGKRVPSPVYLSIYLLAQAVSEPHAHAAL